MDGAVGVRVVQPLPVIDAGIRRVSAHNEGEGAHGMFGLVQAKVAVATGDVLHDDFFTGVTFGPLAQVAAAAHDAASTVVEVHQDREVGKGGFADLYHKSRLVLGSSWRKIEFRGKNTKIIPFSHDHRKKEG